MPKIAYIDKRFHGRSKELIKTSNDIIAEYTAAGFTLTLRQLYYQLVARGFIPNRDTEYRKLGSIVNDARLAGLIDWNAIEDRTRTLRSLSHWDTPADIIESAANGYNEDLWAEQSTRLEVWIEKDALVGVIEGVCESNDVPYFSCRGYSSQSSMWRAAQRIIYYEGRQQGTRIIHLGDHDPSGIDMTRDIQERLSMFCGWSVDVQRIALTMDQVEQYNPPPNPAKLTDTRALDYIAEYGNESWELDALEPQAIADLIQEAVDDVRDDTAWFDAQDKQEHGRTLLNKASAMWPRLVEVIEEGDED